LSVTDDWTALRSARVIDLSVTVAADLPAAWPTHMPFQAKVWNYFVPLRELQGSIPSSAPYQTRFWVIDEHTGTHFDAPIHFVPPAGSGLPWAGPAGAETGDQVPVRDLMGPAVVVDVTELAGRSDHGQSPWITRTLLESWEQRQGRSQPATWCFSTPVGTAATSRARTETRTRGSRCSTIAGRGGRRPSLTRSSSSTSAGFAASASTRPASEPPTWARPLTRRG
jgi:kynurenine formamidase